MAFHLDNMIDEPECEPTSLQCFFLNKQIANLPVGLPMVLEMGPLAQALISLDSQAVCEVTKPQSQTGLSDGSKSFTSWGEEKPSLRSCSQSGQQDSRRVGSSSGDGGGAQPREGA